MIRSLVAAPVLLSMLTAGLAFGQAAPPVPAAPAPAPAAPPSPAPAPSTEPPTGTVPEATTAAPEPTEVQLTEETPSLTPGPAPGFQAPPPPPAPGGIAPTGGHTAREGAPFDDAADEPAPPAPSLYESRFQLQGVLETQWPTDPSFDLVSEDEGVGSGGVSAGYAVLSTTDWAVVPELGWARQDTSRDALFGGGIETATLVDDRFHAGVSLRYALASVFEPHVRVSGGLDVVNADIEAPSTPTLVQEEVTPFGAIGAGATLHTTPGGLSRRGFARTLLLGVTVEGGYSFSPSIDLNPKPDGGVARVSTGDVSFGSLSRSGPYLRFAATIRL